LKIAILGASANPEKFGNKAVRAYTQQGHTVFPVNPKEKEICGLPCFSSLVDISDEIDTISLYLPPAVSLQVVDEIIAKNPRLIYLNPGTENGELEKRLKEAGILIRKQCSIVAIGVNPAQV
jgi:hypothetical protein